MITRNNDVWVFIEHRGEKTADVSLELLSKGRKLAYQLNGNLKAVVIGFKVESIAKETFRYGATEVLLADHPELEHYRTLSYSRVLSELVDKYRPGVVLFGATIIGRDLAPRIASFIKSGLTADCTSLKFSFVPNPYPPATIIGALFKLTLFS